MGRVFDINAASAVLEWDQQTYMPPGGSEGRAHQISTLRQLSHEMFISDEFGEAIERGKETAGDLDPDSEPRCILRYVNREYQKKRRVPAEWVGEFSRTTSRAIQVWQQARQASHFSLFEPLLREIISLRTQYAEFFAPYDSIYDPLLDDFEPGMKSAAVREVFDVLRPAQVELIQAITERGTPVDDDMMHQEFDPQSQWEFGIEVIKTLGYDFDRGRQDKATHPFTTSFNLGDVRITTRIYRDYLPSAMFSSMHEAGHALYEQGVRTSLDRTPLIGGASLAVHESQSRMWENLVGRSLPFWTAFFPRLQAHFPEQLGDLDVIDFYRAINKVEPSLIRVEADEATYNLHIMLRFDLELALLKGELAVVDLPEAWNSKMEEYLGIMPPDDAKGVLQDIHWSSGILGYFPTYALGNLVASQLWDRMLQDIPNVHTHIAAGSFTELLEWLREHIHQYGAMYEPLELLKRVTGEGLNPKPYLGYLREKYSQVYNL
jgi:carboxypeptidase Taq